MASEVPKKISKSYLDELSKSITGDQLAYLYEVTNDHATDSIRNTIDPQVPSEEEIFENLSRLQYFEQELKISDHLSVTLRTLESSSNDEALRFAISESKKDDSNYDLFWRIRNRKRLSYALKSINGKPLCAERIDGSYVEYMMSGIDVNKELERLSVEVYKTLCIMPEIFVERINNFFGIWESMVYDKIRNSNLNDIVKN